MNGNRWAITAAAIVAVGIAARGGLASPAPAETLRPLVQEALPDVPGYGLTAVEVSFPPGAKAVPHRHGKAFLYVHVLAGSVRSQIEGEPVRAFRTGESWTEKPGDHHVITENASATEAARLLVVFIAPKGDALKTDDRPHEP
ncbi:cupin domain-containing protein [Methylobacterium sp. BTF04]|uniref:cupin domain-containing protein n=1 Tax=Methylobacterium sp. BTF04 TaxID=2708300 RepID=UPI0013D218C2|nr:cupin domain-containing protein [Methylobacterium sp. BTF04]